MNGQGGRNGLRVVDELLTYRSRRLDAGIGEFHQAIDLLKADTVPESYWQKVKAGQEAQNRERA